ncbi:MAG TPA: hypothetical protein VH458_07850 [Vicinamibacterales bacterium]|jgi:hypothetical protein
MALGLTLVFLSSVARFYHPGTGFTALIGFPEGADDQAPALRGLPHYQYPAWASYDGQFYAQRALDPLLRDPQVDRGMDSAPFRARRILFSWTAYVLGFGRPAWILEVFALQNVASWLLLAWLVTRWLPLRSPRALSLWFACLFSHGLLWSVRFALLDGPSLLLTMLAVRAAEQGRRGLSGTIAGINGLGRETNVLGALAQPPPGSLRDAFRLVGALALVALPLLIWEDYLRSIYRSTIFADTGQLAIPGTAVMSTVARLVKATRAAGVLSVPGLQLGIVVSVVVQAVYVVVRPRPDVPCWRVAAGYIVLMLLINRVLWDPVTGAITRVMLPLTVSFNILLQRETSAARFWAWFVAGNLHVLASFQVMPFV